RIAWRADAGSSFIDGVLWAEPEPRTTAQSLLRHALSKQPWQGPRLAAFSNVIASIECDPVICVCRQVTDSAIRGSVREGADVAALKEQLGCGTVCGSCIPQLTQYVAQADAMHAGSPAGPRVLHATLPGLGNDQGNDR
ncbi:MAG TPA: (2Fe-2S)-binding protein, partial [Lysobacter sp.]